MRKEDLLSDDPRALLEQAEQFLKQFKTGEDLNGFLAPSLAQASCSCKSNKPQQPLYTRMEAVLL